MRQNLASINGVELVPLVAHADDRGYLVEVLRNRDPHFTKFGQVYLVGNFGRGVIRAFHKHEVLWDWFFISHGAAKFVLVDDRADSPTWGHMNVFIASDRNLSLLGWAPSRRSCCGRGRPAR